MKWVILVIFGVLFALTNNIANAIQMVHTIEIRGFEFVPKVTKVSKGDKVIWINRDAISHNIVNSKNDIILSQTLIKDAEFSYIVETSLNYLCGFHPSMRGELQVIKIK